MIAAVVAVLITASEAFAEVVVVLVSVYVVASVAVVRVLVRIGIPIVAAPAILAVCLSGTEALFITVVNGLAEQICAVLIRLVVPAAAIVSIARSRIEIRIAIVIVVARLLNAKLLLTQTLQITLLITVLRQPSLLL